MLVLEKKVIVWQPIHKDGKNADQKPQIMQNDIQYKIKHVHANYDNCHMLAHYSNW